MTNKENMDFAKQAFVDDETHQKLQAMRYEGWLDREILEYAGMLIEQIKFLETQYNHSESENTRDALVDSIDDKKGMLVSCISELSGANHIIEIDAFAKKLMTTDTSLSRGHLEDAIKKL